LAAGAAASALAFPAIVRAQNKTITWATHPAILAATGDGELLKQFEAKTGIKVELSQYAIQDMIPKTVAAMAAGTTPDVAYADVYDFATSALAGNQAISGGHSSQAITITADAGGPNVYVAWTDLRFHEIHDPTGPARLEYSLYWREDNDNPALQRFFKLIEERYPG
jgi:ABC-type glycerol-3-phosphate transport system substrate-binding protein